jgi:hypothetical protein
MWTFLERIYLCVDAPIFQTISQESVQSCCHSLLDIAEAVDKAARDAHPLRAPLLALSHFMVRKKETENNRSRRRLGVFSFLVFSSAGVVVLLCRANMSASR